MRLSIHRAPAARGDLRGDSDRGRVPAEARRGGEAPRQEAPPQKRPWYRRPLVLGALAIILLALIVAGVLWWLNARQYVSTDDAFIDAHMTRISPQVAGRVARVLVTDNEAVKPGQTLVEIDPAPLQAALDEAEANAAAAKGRLAQAQAQQAVAQANAQEAQAEVDVAQANATNTAATLKRDRTLVASHVISRQQLDDATAAAKSAAANLEAARKKAAAAEAQHGLAASQIEAAQADLRSAAAQVEQAKLNLSYTTIVALVAGWIADKSVAIGDYLQPGQALMSLVPYDVWVTANFKETQLHEIKAGAPVDISVDAYPGHGFKGHVDSIASGSGAAFSLLPPENATGNFVKVVQRVPVKIVFDHPVDPKYRLGPGMSVVPSVKVE